MEKKSSISVVVFDEAHCISQWGLDFRPDYRRVSTLQSWLSAPTLVLTATVTKKTQEDLFEVLGLTEENTHVVAALPDRPNIFLHLEQVVENFEEELKWLPDHLKQEPTNVKKMIIYVRSINTCQQMFTWLLDELEEGFFFGGERIPENRIVEMFHANTDDISKKRIMEQFISTSGHLKLLISTVAFGMGVNIKDVDLIIHWGLPSSSLCYWQEIGRCARDGRNGYAICYSFKRSENICQDDSLKKIVEKESPVHCLREVLLQNFLLKGIPESALVAITADKPTNHDTCDKLCACSKCSCCSKCIDRCKCSKKSKNILDSFLKRRA